MKNISFKKAIVQIHLWLGLTSGLVVFVLGITGCIYVFEDELKSFFYKDRMYVDVPQGSSRKTLSELLLIAQKTFGKKHPIQQIEIPAGADRSYLFKSTSKGNPDALTYFGEQKYYHVLYINPYTGEVIKDENTKYEFFQIVLRLHRNLLLNKEIGHYVVGISVLIFVVLLITGIILWWPKNMAALKQRLLFKWKSTTQLKRKNYDLHNILGFYSFFFALLIALTGLTWSFDWFDDGVQWLANGGKSKKTKTVISEKTKSSATSFPIDLVFYNVSQQNPNTEFFSISFPKDKKSTLNVSVYANEQLNYNKKQFQYDQYSAKLLKTGDFENKNSGEKLRSMNYDIHVGRILHLPGKILTFLISLIISSLPVTGFIIWWKRKSKR